MNSDGLKVFVSEDTKPGTVITVISATDVDTGDFGTVTYAIDNKEGQDAGFRIDPNSGEVSLTKQLDREKTPVHSLLVQAWDNYHHGYSAGQSRNTWAQLTIVVKDVNDEAPEFIEVDQGCITISEFQKKHESITTVRAIDKVFRTHLERCYVTT